MADVACKELDCDGEQDNSEEFAQYIDESGTQKLLYPVYGFEYHEYEHHVERKGNHYVDG